MQDFADPADIVQCQTILITAHDADLRQHH